MPKPFIFKLERVLIHRQQLEDQAVAILAKAQAEHDVQQKTLEELKKRLIEHQKQGIKAKSTAADIWLSQQYELGLQQNISEAQEELSKLALKLQKCRQEAVARSKDKKLLEKLKEKESKRYYHESTLREQKEFEEITILRRTNKSN